MGALGGVKGDGQARRRWTDGGPERRAIKLRPRQRDDRRIEGSGVERGRGGAGIPRLEDANSRRAQRVSKEAPPLRITLENQHLENRAHAAQGSPAMGRGPSAPVRVPRLVTPRAQPCLSTLAPGARVRTHLLVVEVERRLLGVRPATLLTLANASGRLPSAPLWDEARHRVAELAAGSVVEVSGRIGTFRGRRQLDIESIRTASRGLVDARTLLPTLADAHSCWTALDRWRAGIRSAGLGRVTALFYDDPVFRQLYQECPASPSGHHAALGGLLRHTFEVASIGRAIATVAGADRDLVLAGALLHDIGKLDAYTWSGPFEVSPAGALLGHVALGARMLDRKIREAPAPPCSPREHDLLLHLVLSHHGRLEFGAAVEPMTLEAEILHYADDASAKSASMAEALRDPANFNGSARLSVRIWQLERRRVYRGEGEFSAEDATR